MTNSLERVFRETLWETQSVKYNGLSDPVKAAVRKALANTFGSEVELAGWCGRIMGIDPYLVFHRALRLIVLCVGLNAMTNYLTESMKYLQEPNNDNRSSARPAAAIAAPKPVH